MNKKYLLSITSYFSIHKAHKITKGMYINYVVKSFLIYRFLEPVTKLTNVKAVKVRMDIFELCFF